MTFREAEEKAKKMAIQNRRQIYFIMGKDDQFEVFVGWDGRDAALKDGYIFPKYSMTLGRYTTNFSKNDSNIID